jgi:hypothetical protein
MSDTGQRAYTAAAGLVAGAAAGALAWVVGPGAALVAPTVGIWFLGGVGLGFGYSRYPELVAANPPDDEDGFSVTTRRGWLAMNAVGAVASAVLFVGLMWLVSGPFDTPRAAAWAGIFFAATMPITTGVMVVYGLRNSEGGENSVSTA